VDRRREGDDRENFREADNRHEKLRATKADVDALVAYMASLKEK